MTVPVTVAVEGPTDLAVVERLLAGAGASVDRAFTVSKPAILDRIPGYNEAARHTPWYVQIDLDRDYMCPPSARREWLPAPSPNLAFAIAECEVEAWLLADAVRLAAALRCPVEQISRRPDEVEDPKGHLLRLARLSSNATVRSQFLPRPRSGRRVGPEYASELIRFAGSRWRPDVARQRSPSLARAMDRIAELVVRWS